MTGRRKLFAGIDKLDEAESEVVLARAHMSVTIDEIQARLAPSQLLDDTIDGIKTRSADLAESVGEIMRDRPGTAAASVAGVALLLARKPIARLARRLLSRS